MVEHTLSLDYVFNSLADATRRDILRRVAKKELSVGEIAAPYRLTFAAISKHLKVLEKAHLIVKHRRGKEQIVQLRPQAFKNAEEYLEWYKTVWNSRFDRLDALLKEQKRRQ
jgi:DNA-binding transcriptional ArsR family regulator